MSDLRGALRAELLRLRWGRLSLLALALAGAVAGLTALVWAVVPAGAAPDGAASTVPGSLPEMATTRGLVAALGMATPQLGLVAMVLAALAVGSEYRHGTWGHLLVRQPRRLVLVAGKLVGSALVAGVLLVVAVLVSVGTSVAMAGVRVVPTAAWWSADGTAALASATGRAGVVVLCCSALGTGLALLTRSSIAALLLGVVWFLLVEPAASAVLAVRYPAVAAWLPRALLDAVAWGRASSLPTLGLTEATGRAALVSAALLGLACWAFRRRDLLA